MGGRLSTGGGEEGDGEGEGSGFMEDDLAGAVEWGAKAGVHGMLLGEKGGWRDMRKRFNCEICRWGVSFWARISMVGRAE